MTLFKLDVADMSEEDKTKVKAYEATIEEYKGCYFDDTVEVPRCVLATFPRSGNSMMRGFSEKITGVSSGSHYNPANLVNYGLIWQGFKGE